MTAYKPRPFEIAGVDLFGRRNDDGTVTLGSTTADQHVLPDFPDQIEVCGAVYSLEVVRKNKDDSPVVANNPSHPGYNIEWGIYV